MIESITIGVALIVGAAIMWLYLEQVVIKPDRRLHANTIDNLEAQIKDLTRSVSEEHQRAEIAISRIKDMEANREQMREAFKSLAGDTLVEATDRLFALADSKFKSELEKRETSLGTLVAPLKEKLGEVTEKVTDIEKQRVDAYAGIREMMGEQHRLAESLRQETGKLSKALRQPTVRGRWGEEQLKRVVELAGMSEYCDFETQVHMDGIDGAVRPDMIVTIPGGGKIVVDSKAPLTAYLDALEEDNDSERESLMRQHAVNVKNHIKALGDKKYWDRFPEAPEFVILFIPGESFLSAAVMTDPHLVEFGIERGVIIASPTTLVMSLKGIAWSWKQEKMAKSAQEIANLGGELVSRLETYSDHMGRVGRGLDTANKAYNSAVGSFDSRVLPSARKLSELGVGNELEAPGQTEVARRIPQDVG